MKKQIIKEFITVKYVRYLPRPQPPPPPPAPRRILVVGRCTLDIVTVSDDFPTEDVFHNTDEGYLQRGGSASNICTVLRRLNARCEFLGSLSGVPAFEYIIFDFMASGIEIKNCPRIQQNPPQRMVILTRDKATCTSMHVNSSEMELMFQQFLGAVDFRHYSWIHFETSNARETYRMIRAVRDYNERAGDKIIISIDLPNLLKQNLTLADLADYVFVRREIQEAQSWMNGHESCRMMRDKLNLRRAVRKSLQKKETPYETDDEAWLTDETNGCQPLKDRLPIIVCPNTLEGACCVDENDKFIKVSGHKPEGIVDKFCENDTFCGAFIYAMDVGKMSLRDALEYGTRVVAFKLAHIGLSKLRCVPKDLISFYYQ